MRYSMLQALGGQAPDDRLAELVPRDFGAIQTISDAMDNPALRGVVRSADAHREQFPVHTGGPTNLLNVFGIMIPKEGELSALGEQLHSVHPGHTAVWLRSEGMTPSELEKRGKHSKFWHKPNTDREAMATVFAHELGHVLSLALGLPTNVVKYKNGWPVGDEVLADLVAFRPSPEQLDAGDIDQDSYYNFMGQIGVAIKRSQGAKP